MKLGAMTVKLWPIDQLTLVPGMNITVPNISLVPEPPEASIVMLTSLEFRQDAKSTSWILTELKPERLKGHGTVEEVQPLLPD